MPSHEEGCGFGAGVARSGICGFGVRLTAGGLGSRRPGEQLRIDKPSEALMVPPGSPARRGWDGMRRSRVGRPRAHGSLVVLASVVGLVGILAGAAACGPSANRERAEALSLGTSSVGSAFYTLAVGMAEVLAKEAGMSITAEPIGGSDANLRALAAGKVDLAMLNADAATAAFHGTGQFVQDGKIPISLIAQGQLSLRQIVVRAEAGIQTPADLAGKRFIMRRPALGDVEAVGRALLAAYGLTESQVTVLSTTETNDAIEALKIGSADAALIPGGVPASFLLDLSQSARVRFLSIPDEKLEPMLEALGPAFRKGVIPAGTYRGQDADVRVPAIAALLVARAGLPDDLVYRLTKALFTNPDQIRRIHSAAADWTVENSLFRPPFPFHPGAARYFGEQEGQSAKPAAHQ